MNSWDSEMDGGAMNAQASMFEMPRNDYPHDFDTFWSSYPARSGGNPKRAAFKAWSARLKEGIYPRQMIDGAGRYRNWCDVMEQTGTPFVMQAATFLGPDHRFLEDYEAPAAKKPKTNEEWHKLGRTKGLEPRTGESWADYKRRVNAAVFGG